jgi:hypothetical protein
MPITRSKFLFIPMTAALVVAFGCTTAAAGLACLFPRGGDPSASPGKFCGGPDPIPVGRGVNLNLECQHVHGTSASAMAKTPDAYGWVCKVPGQADKAIDMNRACVRLYGTSAIATLVGIGANDWRCLTPDDVSGRVVPVLLYPMEHVVAGEVGFAADSLKRLNTLVSGVRSFYQEKTSLLVPGTNAFILPTPTSAGEWQNLALCTDQDACAAIGNPYPWIDGGGVSRFRYLKRIETELIAGGWKKLISPGSMRLAAFVTLGASPSVIPTWCGAGDFPGTVSGAAPSNAYVSCDPTTYNAPDYEDAFYGTAHELGHGMGLPHSDDLRELILPDKVPLAHRLHGDVLIPRGPGCPNASTDTSRYIFNDVDPNSRWLRPPAALDSIMCLGKGTSSALYPYEAYRLQIFLLGWN